MKKTQDQITLTLSSSNRNRKPIVCFQVTAMIFIEDTLTYTESINGNKKDTWGQAIQEKPHLSNPWSGIKCLGIVTKWCSSFGITVNVSSSLFIFSSLSEGRPAYFSILVNVFLLTTLRLITSKIVWVSNLDEWCHSNFQRPRGRWSQSH